jgi:nucleoside-diphosphate-sugar epimerase
VHVVLLGGAGYIGTVAARHLINAGHRVTVVDGLIYQRADDPHRLLPAAVEFVHADLRDTDALHKTLTGADAVVHMGGLVGEPACTVDERLAVELNFASPVLAAVAARALGVPHYVLFSSCSVYGQHEGTVAEDTAPNPLGIYAHSKVLAEQHVSRVLDGVADVTVLRLATVHGPSPRQRLDSVVNRMTAQATATGRVPLNGGSQRRPLVHIADVGEVVAAVLARPRGHQVLNVGADRENYTIAQIAETVAAVLPGTRVDRGPERDEADARDYHTSFQKLAALVPGSCATPLADGIRQIAEAIVNRQIADPDLAEYDNFKGLKACHAACRLQPIGSTECDHLYSAYLHATRGANR